MQHEIHPYLPRLRIRRRRGDVTPRGISSAWVPYLPFLASLLLLPVLYGVSWLALKQSQAKASHGRTLNSAPGYSSHLPPSSLSRPLGGLEPLWSHQRLQDAVASLHRMPPDGGPRERGATDGGEGKGSWVREELKAASMGVVLKGEEDTGTPKVLGSSGYGGLELSGSRGLAGGAAGGNSEGVSSAEQSEPTSLKHIFFNIGSSTRMWPRRQKIIR